MCLSRDGRKLWLPLRPFRYLTDGCFFRKRANTKRVGKWLSWESIAFARRGSGVRIPSSPPQDSPVKTDYIRSARDFTKNRGLVAYRQNVLGWALPNLLSTCPGQPQIQAQVTLRQALMPGSPWSFGQAAGFVPCSHEPPPLLHTPAAMPFGGSRPFSHVQFMDLVQEAGRGMKNPVG